MFELITGTSERPLRERSLGSKVIAAVFHSVLIVVVVGIPLLLSKDQLPPVVPTMVAFVAAPPAPPTPPPPPPPPAPAPKGPVAEPARTTGAVAAPIAAPNTVEPEHLSARNEDRSSGGVLGGVEGGVAGGVLGGIVGGIVTPVAPPPPPPPPPPPAVANGPVRIGGQITAPALIHRVEPVYPDIAAFAQVGGLVILEAVVNTDGCVQATKILRSRHPLLDRAAQEALQQWQYTPLVLNGIATPFVLTVTFNFSVKK